jgi:hypothetical protein
MDEQMQHQIDQLNSKMDLVLEYIRDQQLRSMAQDDLLKDLAIVGKDAYDSTVQALDQQQVEIDPAELQGLLLKIIRNIGTFGMLMDTLESVNDLLKDATPLLTEAIIDFSRQLHRLNERGVLDAFKAIALNAEKIMATIKPEEINKIGQNADLIVAIASKLSDRELLQEFNKMLGALQSTVLDGPKPASPIKLLMSSEMKQASGFMLELIRNIRKNNQ